MTAWDDMDELPGVSRGMFMDLLMYFVTHDHATLGASYAELYDTVATAIRTSAGRTRCAHDPAAVHTRTLLTLDVLLQLRHVHGARFPWTAGSGGADKGSTSGGDPSSDDENGDDDGNGDEDEAGAEDEAGGDDGGGRAALRQRFPRDTKALRRLKVACGKRGSVTCAAYAFAVDLNRLGTMLCEFMNFEEATDLRLGFNLTRNGAQRYDLVFVWVVVVVVVVVVAVLRMSVAALMMEAVMMVRMMTMAMV